MRGYEFTSEDWSRPFLVNIVNFARQQEAFSIIPLSVFLQNNLYSYIRENELTGKGFAQIVSEDPKLILDLQNHTAVWSMYVGLLRDFYFSEKVVTAKEYLKRWEVIKISIGNIQKSSFSRCLQKNFEEVLEWENNKQTGE